MTDKIATIARTRQRLFKQPLVAELLADFAALHGLSSDEDIADLLGISVEQLMHLAFKRLVAMGAPIGSYLYWLASSTKVDLFALSLLFEEMGYLDFGTTSA